MPLTLGLDDPLGFLFDGTEALGLGLEELPAVATLDAISLGGLSMGFGSASSVAGLPFGPTFDHLFDHSNLDDARVYYKSLDPNYGSKCIEFDLAQSKSRIYNNCNGIEQDETTSDYFCLMYDNSNVEDTVVGGAQRVIAGNSRTLLGS